MPKVVYTNTKGLHQVSGTGGLNLNEGRLREAMTATDVDAQNNTLTAAQINAGIVVHTSVTGGGTVTTDTAANIISNCGLDENNQVIKVYYVNDGDQTLTFAGGSGVTIADTGSTILTNEAAMVLFQRTSSTAVKAFVIH